MLIALTDPDVGNLDLGRDLQFADIVSDDVFPLEDAAIGTFCYACQCPVGCTTGLAALTRSTGVFTSLIRCDMDAPVYVCLEHLPFCQDQFEAFAPEVAAQLKAARRARHDAPTHVGAA